MEIEQASSHRNVDSQLDSRLDSQSRAAIELREVCKTYGFAPALQSVSLSVFAGEIVALVGLNGAGKSTLLRCAAGLAIPDRGDVSLFQRTIRNYRSDSAFRRTHRMSYVSTESFFYSHLSIRENLELIASIDGLPNRTEIVESVCQRFGFAQHAHKSIYECSEGTARRAAIARAFIRAPNVLFLDEAFLGLDIFGTTRLVESIVTLRKQGSCVVMASHDEVILRELAHRIVVLRRGRVHRILTTQEFQGLSLEKVLSE